MLDHDDIQVLLAALNTAEEVTRKQSAWYEQLSISDQNFVAKKMTLLRAKLYQLQEKIKND